MSPARGDVCLIEQGFPRVSGDEPSLETVAPPGGEFSPRERG